MIFIDTGAFIALHAPNDQYHRRAESVWSLLAQTAERCFTSNFILDETLNLLARRAGYGAAAELARNLYVSRTLQILRPELEHELDALSFFEKFADQEVSFTDCVSFALMRAHRIHRAFSFDRHFQLLGFEVVGLTSEV